MCCVESRSNEGHKGHLLALCQMNGEAGGGSDYSSPNIPVQHVEDN